MATYHIEGMKCQGCADTVKKAFEGVPGVTSASVNLDDKTANVEGQYSKDALQHALDGTNYKIQD